MNRVFQRTIRVTGFLIIFMITFAIISAILFPKWDEKENTVAKVFTFYAQPKNSIDVLFLGASTYRNGIFPLDLWGTYGFTSYTRATGGQSPMVSYYYLLESLNYQHPRVVVLDGSSLSFDYNVDEREFQLRQSTDLLAFSVVKIQLIDDIVSKSKTQTFASYLFPLLRYHNRWKSLKPADFGFHEINRYDPFKGFNMDFRLVDQKFPANYMQPSNAIKPIVESSRFYYEKIIQLCKENDIAVLIVTLPRVSWTYAFYIGIKQFADEQGLMYIDYSLPELRQAIGFDETKDFYDVKHMNINGALKISQNLGAYLQEKYHFTDKRNDPAYQQWNEDFQVLKDQIKRGDSK